jgi:UDP-2,4-diacetamido-2,4,6-trideoxy-beta-L-altropyranose hydrolase
MDVLFRSDASVDIGFGHLMRSVALAECLQSHGGRVRFLLREEAGARRVLQQARMPVTWLRSSASLDEVEEAVRQAAEPWVVIDSYEQPQRQCEAARRAGARVLVMDDLGGLGVEAQWLVNPNLDAEPSWYPDANGAHLLLGAAYAMVRRELLAGPRMRQPAAGPVRRILVTLGGSERRNRTALVLNGLNALPAEVRRRLSVDVVLGPGFRHQAQIEALAKSVGYDCAVHRDVVQMSALYARADLAITAAGSTVYETAFLGIPSLTLTLSANQARNASAFSRQGVAVSLGDAETLAPSMIAHHVAALMRDSEQRTAMSARGRLLIDGQGVERIRGAMMGAGQPRPRMEAVA